MHVLTPQITQRTKTNLALGWCTNTCLALPTRNQIDSWNHLYLSIFPVGHAVILL